MTPAFEHRGGRLSLREFTPADAADIQALHADPRVRALLPDAQPLHDAAWAAAFAARLGDFYRRHPGLGIWRCDVRDGGAERFAGWFSLMPTQAHPEVPGLADDDAELGSRLHPEHWGSGLSLAGGTLLLDHAFDTLGLRRVWGICHPGNRGALACLRALGFSPRAGAPYEGQPAEYHAVDAEHWRRWRTLPRRDRLRRPAPPPLAPATP